MIFQGKMLLNWFKWRKLSLKVYDYNIYGSKVILRQFLRHLNIEKCLNKNVRI